ncbi:hypothetical protein HNY73_010634 [Argiope bruennichi]|uniref:Uncharacterized protein n=1 Tax=Argiope bruennichi TaxID=94029 RepID=A0A8T0F447_ARGBR|nr:hypothetical protein HNY73_010634 [Argiope bruennichi]
MAEFIPSPDNHDTKVGEYLTQIYPPWNDVVPYMAGKLEQRICLYLLSEHTPARYTEKNVKVYKFCDDKELL